MGIRSRINRLTKHFFPNRCRPEDCPEGPTCIVDEGEEPQADAHRCWRCGEVHPVVIKTVIVRCAPDPENPDVQKP